MPRPKKSPVLIYGTGNQAAVVFDTIMAGDKWGVEGFIDYEQSCEEFCDLPVYPVQVLEQLYREGISELHLALPDLEREQRAFEQAMAIGFKVISVIHPSAAVSKFSTLGRNCFIGPQSIVGPFSQLSDFCRVNNGASVAHHVSMGTRAILADKATVAGDVNIGNNVLVGLGVTINRGVTIGDDVIITSGANIFSNVEAGQIIKQTMTVGVGGKKL
jgi:sugar O-acyltransferase (sialic acid O-acetyltransferase NeuD family)